MPSARKLAASTVAALAVALLVLVTSVLPAEFGVDPTGVGRALGFTRLSDPGPLASGDVAEDPRDPFNRTVYRMSAEWVLVESRVGVWNGTVRELKTERVAFPLSLTNVTSVTALLAWSDENGSRPDELEISLSGAGRTSQLARAFSGPDGRGNASSTLQVRSVPFPRAEADGVTIPFPGEDRSAVGDWTAIVRGYEIGDFADGREDDAARWQLTILAERYELAHEVDATGRGDFDRVTITLPPNEDVEYKLLVDRGAEIEYRWRSTLPVYVDFHGDTEANPDEFVQYRVMTAAEDAGEQTAEFSGRLGWYFKNDESSPLTIVLETRGDYRILGAI